MVHYKDNLIGVVRVGKSKEKNSREMSAEGLKIDGERWCVHCEERFRGKKTG